MEKSGFFTVPKAQGKDFISLSNKKANPISPDCYKRTDYNLFKTDPKIIRLYYSKDNRVSICDAEAKALAWVPGPAHYDTCVKDKFFRTLGTIKL